MKKSYRGIFLHGNLQTLCLPTAMVRVPPLMVGVGEGSHVSESIGEVIVIVVVGFVKHYCAENLNRICDVILIL
jgi:hypothetical protein